MSDRVIGRYLVATRHVVGLATGYSVDQIAPFVRSLRAGFDRAVTLVVDDSPDMRAFLAEHRVFAVTLVPSRGVPRRAACALTRGPVGF